MAKLQMTHNEYLEFLRTNVSRIYNEKGYSHKRYLDEADNVEILPFNLSAFNLTEEIKTTINNIFTEETTSKNGEYMLKGFSQTESEWYKITDKLKLKRVMGYHYSGYCFNEELNIYMTYSEGDLFLKLFTSETDYKLSLKETIEWYENENN